MIAEATPIPTPYSDETNPWRNAGIRFDIAVEKLGLDDGMRKILRKPARLLLGLTYVFAAWRAGIELRVVNVYRMLFAVTIDWACDTMAFFVGRAI
jgi:hypothetical protein